MTTRAAARPGTAAPRPRPPEPPQPPPRQPRQRGVDDPGAALHRRPRRHPDDVKRRGDATADAAALSSLGRGVARDHGPKLTRLVAGDVAKDPERMTRNDRTPD